MEFTKKELVFLYTNLSTMKDYEGFDFRYMIASNLNLLKDEYEAITEASKPNARVLEYVEKKNQLFAEFAAKDKKGNPKIVTEGQITRIEFDPERTQERIEKIERLTEEYKTDIDKENKRLEDVDEKLNKTTVQYPLMTFKKDSLPNDIGVDHMTALFPLMET